MWVIILSSSCCSSYHVCASAPFPVCRQSIIHLASPIISRKKDSSSHMHPHHRREARCGSDQRPGRRLRRAHVHSPSSSPGPVMTDKYCSIVTCAPGASNSALQRSALSRSSMYTAACSRTSASYIASLSPRRLYTRTGLITSILRGPQVNSVISNHAWRIAGESFISSQPFIVFFLYHACSDICISAR